MNKPLEEWNRHKSPEGVAEYFLNEGRNVGRVYSTHEEIWQVSDEKVSRGLLSLILQELRNSHHAEAQQTRDLMQHRDWLNYEYESDKKLCDGLQKQRARVSAMIGDNKLRSLVQRDDLGRLQRNYGSTGYYKTRRGMIAKLKQLKSVKSIKDLANIDGVGKATVAKLLATS